MHYETLLRIIDQIRHEAPSALGQRYRPDLIDAEKVNQARSRSFIHLFMKVMFGLTDFNERERTITDASYDGGIDAYHIDAETKTIYFIQSKFRTNEKNFSAKQIELDDLLAMDVSRVLEGETSDESGNPYNGKIKQLQREVSSLPDIARYSYKIVLLANLTGVSPTKLRQLSGGFAVEVFDFAKTYKKLVFPVLTGTYFTASDILIPIDLSSKNAGAKISYNVSTRHGNCEITVLFVPTIEIAKLMHKYKNAILKFNPRSYLDLEGRLVNDAVRSTILDTETNEFALFNNGITMLSEETNINEKIGQKNKAQLRIKNPQIINGGQTSFTLSRIYSENTHLAEKIFDGKEVLLKVITLLDNNSESSKLSLIEEISDATNKQTPVINADQFANDAFHLEIQKIVFDRYGLLYERKRGEFSDGVRDHYVSISNVIERNLFWRLYFAANGRIDLAIQKRLFQKNRFPGVNLQDVSQLNRLYLGIFVFKNLREKVRPNSAVGHETYALIYLYMLLFSSQGLTVDNTTISANVLASKQRWREFIESRLQIKGAGHRKKIDKITGEVKLIFNHDRYLRSGSLKSDLEDYFAAANDTLSPAAPPQKKLNNQLQLK